MMIELLSGIRSLVQLRHGVDVDSTVFKLHYSITTTILFGFCCLATASSLVGDPINCLHGKDPRLSAKVVNTYCWIHTTFTLPKYLNQASKEKISHAYPGIGTDDADDERIYHAYYQWVPFTLFIQAILFYIPHWIWNCCEGKKMKSLVEGLQNPIMTSSTKNERVTLLAEYLATSARTHNFYAIKFLTCEALNILITVMNISFLNSLLGGNFYSYGSDVISFSEKNQEDRTDPMIILFPRVTKCTFNLFGPSGTIEKLDMMCVLAMNIFNEKIYIFLWFWFIILATLGSMSFIYRLVVLITPNIRVALLHRKAKFRNREIGEIFNKKLMIGDFFVLHLIGKNLEIIAYSSLVHALHERLKPERRVTPPDIGTSCPDQYGLLNSRV